MKLSDVLTPEQMKAQRTATPAIETTHKLPFEVYDWEPDKSPMAKKLGLRIDSSVFLEFKVGTVFGLWTSDADSYIILAIHNEEPGNGHLEDVFEWFYYSCRRDKKHLRIIELWNEDFAKHLVKKRGFFRFGDWAVKFWESMKAEQKSGTVMNENNPSADA